MIQSRVYIRRSDKDYKMFCKEISNGYIARSREYPQSMVEVNRQMEYYKPIFTKKKSADSSGTSNGS